MGTWGTGITANDTVADIRDFMLQRLKAGSSLAAASAQALAQYKDLDTDPDEGPLLWQAVALVQWKYGDVDMEILDRVRSDLKCERGLDSWRHDPKLLVRRRAALAKFLVRIESNNPCPSPPPKLVVRRARFEEGDCLAVRTEDGRYTAALVLKVNEDNPEFGMNLIAGLDYLEDEPPDIAFFEERRWLVKRYGMWNGEPDLDWYLPVRFRQERKRFTVVGKTVIRRSDPRDARGYTGWKMLGRQILFCRASKS